MPTAPTLPRPRVTADVWTAAHDEPIPYSLPPEDSLSTSPLAHSFGAHVSRPEPSCGACRLVRTRPREARSVPVAAVLRSVVWAGALEVATIARAWGCSESTVSRRLAGGSVTLFQLAMLADLAGVPLERVAARIERALAGVLDGEEVGR